ncbi:MAG TPA: zf-TFIIB domain-containing protein, partial [Acidimicrobiia bacterium]|nr:zf-TFIIB domain-containing protein [Acidimicrobiia bacterium]
MTCPACGASLERTTRDGVDVDECNRCHGTWFDADELRLAKDRTDEDLRWLDFDPFQETPGGATSGPSGRACPHCGVAMDTREYMHSGVRLDVCPDGHGVWLEEGEFAKIVGYLEHVVVSMDAGDYAKAALSELKEIVTHPEGFRSEMKDFSVVLRLL